MDDFYTNFKTKLEETTSFPSDYLYKFIVKAEEIQKIAEIQKVFDGMQTTITNKESKNGNYTSISIQVFMLDADSVIEKYKEVGKIEGVMML